MGLMKKVLYGIICSLFLTNLATTQELYFKHYQVENGLSHNSVITMLQDKRGFLWFGTKDGLNRFDGYNFKLFHHNSKDDRSIGSNYIRCLYEGKNYLWVGTDNGLFRYDNQKESFCALSPAITKPILDIEADKNNNLWFIAGGTLYFKQQETLSSLNLKSYDDFYAILLSKDSNQNIWAASGENVYQYSEESRNFKPITLGFGSIADDLPVIITALKGISKSHMIIGTRHHGAFVYDIKMGTTKKLINNYNEQLYVRDIVEKENGTIWLATESGLLIYDTKSKTYSNFKKSYNDPYSLTDNALYTMTIDKEGGTWIGSYFGGVNYLPKEFTPFKKYFPKEGENSISGNAVREIHQDKNGDYWIGTEDAGLNKLDPNTGKFQTFTPKNSNIAHYNIHGVLPLDNELWVGTFEHGLDVFDINSNQIIRHYEQEEGNPYSIGNNFILDIYKGRDDSVYVMASLGIYTYNRKKDHFNPLKGFPQDFHYAAFLESKDGTLWAATYWDGLYYYNPKTQKKGYFRYDGQDSTSISSNVINGIFQDSKENIWITTENGLNLYQPTSNDFKNYNTRDGLPSNVSYSILEDDDASLWISTSNGLVHFNPSKESFKTYTKANGLLSDQFNYSSAYKNNEGRMFFGSVKGLVSFHPDEFIKNNYDPPVYITNLSINNESIKVGAQNSPLEKSITETSKIILTADQSTFSLDFASLSFTAPEMTEYAYRLIGLNDKWIPLKTKHSVNFTELPSGNYIFQVKSTNSTGVENKETAALEIEVLPPFYFSKLAIFLYTLVFILLFALSLRYYHYRVQRKNNRKIKAFQDEKEKEIYQSKIEFFTNVAHEIRTPLTLIKTPLEKLIGQTKDQPIMQKSLSIMEKNTERLINLVNELLDFRKTEIENIKLTFVEINISETLRNTYTRFSELIQEKAVDFRMKLPQEEVMAFVDEEAIKKIMSNLFNNAIKYAKNEVILKLEVTDSEFILKVQNDGSLIPQHLKKRIFEPFFRTDEVSNQTGTGIGLSLAYSLTELHSGQLILANEDTHLNTFILKLPLRQEQEFNSYKKEPKVIERQQEEIPQEEIINNTAENSGILIVEDNRELLKFIADDFKEEYAVFKSTNAETAIEILKKENIYLIISDVMMNGMDGFEFCEYVKTNLETSHIPVILLTAKNAMQSKIQGLEAGADAYIEKPFSLEYLKVQVSNLIENRRHIMEFYSSSPLSHIKSIAHTKTDERFINKLEKLIYDNLSDQNLNVDSLADIMNMSRSTLYRKIKDLSNLSPNELINIARLKKAAELLQSGEYKIYEISEIVGYKSQTSFGRNFQKQFKMTPSEYMNGKQPIEE